MLLVAILALLGAFILYVAWKSNWDPKATTAAVAAFAVAVWQALTNIGAVPSP